MSTTTQRTETVRQAFTKMGIVAASAVGLAVAMFLFALAHGVHCPECDRRLLGSAHRAWKAYFQIKDALLLAGGLAGLVSIVFASRRRWGGAAVLGAVITVLSTPI